MHLSLISLCNTAFSLCNMASSLFFFSFSLCSNFFVLARRRSRIFSLCPSLYLSLSSVSFSTFFTVELENTGGKKRKPMDREPDRFHQLSRSNIGFTGSRTVRGQGDYLQWSGLIFYSMLTTNSITVEL